jgi:hypothetical protein
MKNYFLLFVVWLAFFNSSVAQERLLTVGFQVKPIIPTDISDAGPVVLESTPFRATFAPALGYGYGMVIRNGFNKSLSYEVGINYVKRKFSMLCEDLDSGITDKSDFGLVSYEIPNQLLVYIQLGERLYMNTAGGISFNAYASAVASKGQNNRFQQQSLLNTGFISFSAIANVGFEYRTEKSGFFYIGASFNKPFKPVTRTTANYERNSFENYSVETKLSGTYLTLDLRYFFHSKPIKEKKNRTEKKKK